MYGRIDWPQLRGVYVRSAYVITCVTSRVIDSLCRFQTTGVGTRRVRVEGCASTASSTSRVNVSTGFSEIVASFRLVGKVSRAATSVSAGALLPTNTFKSKTCLFTFYCDVMLQCRTWMRLRSGLLR